MLKKEAKCSLCGKKIGLEEKDAHFMQVQYRVVKANRVWESAWKTLCEDCAVVFPLSLMESNGKIESGHF